jgi:hypothetical protein
MSPFLSRRARRQNVEQVPYRLLRHVLSDQDDPAPSVSVRPPVKALTRVQPGLHCVGNDRTIRIIGEREDSFQPKQAGADIAGDYMEEGLERLPFEWHLVGEGHGFDSVAVAIDIVAMSVRPGQPLHRKPTRHILGLSGRRVRPLGKKVDEVEVRGLTIMESRPG